MTPFRPKYWLLALGFALAGPATAQVYQHEGGCSSGVGGATAVITGDLFGQGVPRSYRISGSAPPGGTLQPGQTYRISYSLRASCTGRTSDLCLTVQPFDFQLRYVPGTASPQQVADGTLLKTVRISAHECSETRRHSVQITVPNMHPPGSYPGPAQATIGLCPPNRKFACAVHTIVVAEPEVDAGWEVSGVRLRTSPATANNGFTVGASITNQTGRNAWPGLATMWLYPPLSRTPRRIASIEVPPTPSGQRFSFSVNVPGLPAGRHMLQACFSSTHQQDWVRLRCGPRSAVRVH